MIEKKKGPEENIAIIFPKRKRGYFGYTPITQGEMELAMEHTRSAMEAARFLNISYDSFKRYGRMYTDPTTGKNLLETQKEKYVKMRNEIKKRPYQFKMMPENCRFPLSKVLEGKCPEYKGGRSFKDRLLNSGYFEDKCENCGFSERRVSDYKVPLVLEFLDGDVLNFKRENLRFLCYNCYSLLVDNIWKVKRVYL